MRIDVVQPNANAGEASRRRKIDATVGGESNSASFADGEPKREDQR
jgi:hypothetical protein